MASCNPEPAEAACAKVNLTLRVHGRRGDGYHELESLVAFADIGDRVSVVAPQSERPDRLTVSGPFAHGIAGENLLAKAMALLRGTNPDLVGGAVHLDKRLPVAAGLGGGSADAAALLRLVRGLNPRQAGDVPWMDIAARLGSDVPVCFVGRPALIQGRGERILLIPSLPDLHVVLVNPGVALSTASVFAALQAGPAPVATTIRPAPSFSGLAEVLSYVGEHGNDMEPAAIDLAPAVGEIKALLSIQPGCLHAAMSGSGPTCFGIFASADASRRAAVVIAAAKPGWWVEPTRLRGVP